MFLPTSSLSLAAVFLQDTQSESAVQGVVSGVRVTPLVSSPPFIKAASIGLDAVGSTPRPVSENPTSSKVHLTQPFPASVNTSPKTGCLHNDAISKGPAATAVTDAVSHATAPCSVEEAAVAESQTKAGSLQGAAGNSSTSAAVAAVTPKTGCSNLEPSAHEGFTQLANSGADSTAVGAPSCSLSRIFFTEVCD